jgi:hypothetical protein
METTSRGGVLHNSALPITSRRSISGAIISGVGDGDEKPSSPAAASGGFGEKPVHVHMVKPSDTLEGLSIAYGCQVWLAEALIASTIRYLIFASSTNKLCLLGYCLLCQLTVVGS